MKKSERSSRALHQDSDLKKKCGQRLKRIEGQVRGLQRMVEEERYCPEVLTQMSAVHESLRAVERILLRSHLQHCTTEALRSGNDASAQRTYEELTDLFYRHAR